MKTLTQDMQQSLTPAKAIELLQQVNETSNGQYPFATILSCIDSRTSAELIFDQGLGDIFSIRVAGNVINEDILGSMEFACKVAGSKAIVVLGHTKCGAVKGACDHVRMGHLTYLLNKLEPAVYEETTVTENRNSSNPEFVEKVALRNVQLTLQAIPEQSAILKDMLDKGEIALIGGVYDVDTGVVEFFS
jgi:carbonic anhydrase